MRLVAAFLASTLLLITACSADETRPSFTGATGSGGSATTSSSSGGTAGAGGGECTDDFTTDPNNCGACGHSCIGGECKVGVCQPVAADLTVGNPVGVAASDGVLIVSSDGDQAVDQRIFSFALGDTPMSFYSGPNVGTFAAPLALDNDRLLFSQNGDLLSIDKQQPSTYADVEVLIAGITPTAIAVHANYVYAAAGASDGGLMRVSLAGAAQPEVLAVSADGVAVDDDGLFYSVRDTGEVFAAQPDGSSPQLVKQYPPPIHNVVAYGDSLLVNAGGSTLWRLKKDGSSDEKVLEGDISNTSRSFGVRTENTYYWCDGQTGDVFYVPATGAARQVVTGDVGCGGVTFSNNVVYWFGGGKLNALAVL